MSLRRAYSNGRSFDFNYTWAHSIDLGSAAESGAGKQGAALQNIFNTKEFRGSSDFDIRHNISANFLYELPFGKNRKFFAGAPAWLDYAAESSRRLRAEVRQGAGGRVVRNDERDGEAGTSAKTALAGIAEGSQDSLASYKEQLGTTHMYYPPQSAVQMGASAELKRIMDAVREFCFQHQLLGEKTQSMDDVGIRFPDGSTQGRKDRLRLRFDNAFMQLAADGKL